MMLLFIHEFVWKENNIDDDDDNDNDVNSTVYSGVGGRFTLHFTNISDTYTENLFLSITNKRIACEHKLLAYFLLSSMI